jgi:two-component sensor histidine kinase
VWADAQATAAPSPAELDLNAGRDLSARRSLERLLHVAAGAAGAAVGLVACSDPRRVLASIGVAGEADAAALIDRAMATAGEVTEPGFLAAPIMRDSHRVGVVVIAGGESSTPRLGGLMRDVAALAAEEFARDEERDAGDKDREALLAELDHRVKNVLAAVQALAAQSARRAVSLDGFLRTFSGRLKAMASAQELLTATRWRGADLHHLAAAELGGLAPGQIRWEGPELMLCPRAATAMSLVLHELAINAVKYGALSNDRGEVLVRWRRTADAGFELDWTEQGGPPVSPSTREGFGVLLIRDITGRELNGTSTLELPPVGARARITGGRQALADPPPANAATPVAVNVPSGQSVGPPPSPDGDVRGLKVLIVEDAVLLAWELETALKNAGAEVVGSAAELDEAMAMLDRPIDAAVLDANLNGASVRPVAEVLAGRGVPFLFATGYGENRGAPQGFDVPVIRKPYETSQVIAALIDIARR